jgi:hypothetical protein
MIASGCRQTQLSSLVYSEILLRVTSVYPARSEDIAAIHQKYL